jgi:cytochrome bd-type quinol oxidase subunit 2
VNQIAALYNLLGADETKAIQPVMQMIEIYAKWACLVVLGFCSMTVGLYAIYIGWRMAKAEDDAQRKDAKSRVIYAVVGLVGVVVVAGIISGVMTGKPIPISNAVDGVDDAVKGPANAIVDNVKYIVGSVLTVLQTLATCFAVWVGWKLCRPRTSRPAKTRRAI